MSADISGSSRSTFARAVAAEVRAAMAARRVSGKSLAEKVGVSQNYVATRLRDEKPFTLDDIDAIVWALFGQEVAPEEFVRRAWANHGGHVAQEAQQGATVVEGRFHQMGSGREFDGRAVAKHGRDILEDQEMRGEQ